MSDPACLKGGYRGPPTARVAAGAWPVSGRCVAGVWPAGRDRMRQVAVQNSPNPGDCRDSGDVSVWTMLISPTRPAHAGVWRLLHHAGSLRRRQSVSVAPVAVSARCRRQSASVAPVAVSARCRRQPFKRLHRAARRATATGPPRHRHRPAAPPPLDHRGRAAAPAGARDTPCAHDTNSAIGRTHRNTEYGLEQVDPGRQRHRERDRCIAVVPLENENQHGD